MNASRSLTRRIASLGGAVALLAALLGGSAAVIEAGPASAAGTITQVSPFSATIAAGTAFTDQLNTTGNVGPVSFSSDIVLCVPVTVSATGMVSAPDTVPPGSYVIFGTDADGSSNVGTWTFTLNVTGTPPVTQDAPFSGSVAKATPSLISSPPMA